jgi:hypothetical protein
VGNNSTTEPAGRWPLRFTPLEEFARSALIKDVPIVRAAPRASYGGNMISLLMSIVFLGGKKGQYRLSACTVAFFVLLD